jgi:hypothetical protein
MFGMITKMFGSNYSTNNVWLGVRQTLTLSSSPPSVDGGTTCLLSKTASAEVEVLTGDAEIDLPPDPKARGTSRVSVRAAVLAVLESFAYLISSFGLLFTK